MGMGTTLFWISVVVFVLSTTGYCVYIFASIRADGYGKQKELADKAFRFGAVSAVSMVALAVVVIASCFN